MIENDKGSIITVEMPGIGVDQVKIDTQGTKVKINAKYGDKKYYKSLNLAFKPSKKPNISANNGIITIEFLK